MIGISAKFNNAFVEWDIYTDNDNLDGYFTMIWQNPDDWSQWNYRIGDKTGTIKTKWNKDFSQWEIRGDNKIVTAQMIWNNDPRQWRITDNTISLELKTRWGNQLNEWLVEDNARGQFYMSTSIPNDPRDWDIEDELSEDVSLTMKMAIVFLSMFNTVPKN